jgi:predicted MFS family arabinose efflux permease
MVGLFVGMASGAARGSQALALWGWMGVTALSTVAATAALIVRLWQRNNLAKTE